MAEEKQELDPFSDKFIEEAEKFECDGLVVNAGRITKPVGDTGEEGLYVTISIQPTNYDGKVMDTKYRVTSARNGKWVQFLKAMKSMMKGAGKQFISEKDLINHEFRWKRVNASFQKNGEDVAYSYFVPIAYIKDQNEAAPVAETTTQTKVDTPPAAAPAQVTAPAPAPKEPTDEDKILEYLKTAGSGIKKEICEALKMPIPMATRSLVKLAQGKRVRVEGDRYFPL